MEALVDVVVVGELQDRDGSKRDLVPVLQRASRHHSLPIHEGAVGAPEILDVHLASVAGELCVAPGDPIIVEPDRRTSRAPDDDLVLL